MAEKIEIFGIPYTIPTPPKNEKQIGGHKLPITQQKFTKTPIPEYMDEVLSYKKLEGYKDQKEHLNRRIKSLKEKIEDVEEDFKESTLNNISNLETQLERLEEGIKKFKALEKKQKVFIEKEYERFEKGYWFFINGEPTYITGEHYKFLNHFYLVNSDGSGRPTYRDRDRKWYYSWDAIVNDPKCYGMIYPKHRREGATSKADSIVLNGATLNKESHCGIQSKTKEDAEDVFEKVMHAHKDLHWWIKPISSGFDRPKSEMEYQYPQKKTGRKERDEVNERKDRVPKTLNDRIYHLLTGELRSKINQLAANPTAYAGKRLKIFFSDEEGATKKQYDVEKRWKVVKPALKDGVNIYGKSIQIAAIESMDKDYSTGKFKKKFLASFYEKKSELTGETTTGLYSVFIPAYEGLEGFIDEYGRSVIDRPTDEQKQYLIKKNPAMKEIYEKGIGAKEYLMIERKAFEDARDYNGLNNHKRHYPIKWEECFITDSEKSPFDVGIINYRLTQLRDYGNPYVVKYDLVWRNGIKPAYVDGDTIRPTMQMPIVDLVPNEEGGMFNFSFVPKTEDRNQIGREGLYFFAENDLKFVVGCDPFHFGEVSSGRKSDGGISAFMKYNHMMELELSNEPINLSEEELKAWRIANKSRRLIVTYRNRPKTTDDFCDDILKLCWFLGCRCFPEHSTDIVKTYFNKMLCGRLLLYRKNPNNGAYEKNPGGTSKGTFRQSLFDAGDKYIKENANYEVHEDFLEEAAQMRYSDTTDQDTAMACLYSIYPGIMMSSTYQVDKEEDNKEEEELFNTYKL